MFPMMRTPETPLFLWICAAVCAHFMFAEGGDQVATYHEDRSYILQLGTKTRSAVHGKDQTFDIVTKEVCIFEDNSKERDALPILEKLFRRVERVGTAEDHGDKPLYHCWK